MTESAGKAKVLAAKNQPVNVQISGEALQTQYDVHVGNFAAHALDIVPRYLAEIRINVFVFLAMVLTLGLAYFLPSPSWPKGLASYLPLHNLLESASIVISMLVFAVGWNAYSKNLPSNIILLSCLFLGVGLLDLSHLLSFAGMPDYVTPSNPEKAIKFWLSARCLAACALLIVAFIPRHFPCTTINRYVIITTVLTVTGVAHWLFLSYQDVIPQIVIPGKGLTSLKVVVEYGLIALNLAAATAFFNQIQAPQTFNPAALFGAVTTMAVSEFCFTLYANVTDIYNFLGHVFKLVAYVYIYKAIVVTAVENPYKLLKGFQEELARKSSLINSILESTSDVIYAKDNNGRYTLFNTAAANFVGKSIHEVLGKDDTFLFPDDQARMMMERDRTVLASETLETYEEAITTADNKLTTFLSTKGPIFDANGTLLGLFSIARDITESKAVFSKLQESEERFRIMANSAPVLIWLSGTDKLCNWFNLTWLNFTGRSMEQEIGNGWAEGVHPDDFQQCLETYISHFDRREAFQMNYRLKRHDGDYRWIHDNGAPRFDREGHFLGYIGSCTDITDLKTALEKLQDSEALWKFAIEGAGDGVWDWNITAGEIMFSKRWYEIQGFEEGSIGPAVSSWEELVHPNDLPLVQQALQANLAGKTSNFSCEHRVRCKNGEYKWILGRGMVVSRDSDGQPLRAIGTHTDISDRKLSEAERARQQAIIMEASDFIASSDMAAHLTFLNPAGARLVGLPENADLSSLEIKDMHPDWATKRVLEEGVPTVLIQGYWQGESALLNRIDGREIPVSQLLLLHRDENGTPQQLSTIMRDITSFKQTEQALQLAKDEAESLARSKSEFLANMSHEIRTPMNAIIGLSQLALNTPLSPQQHDYLDKILGSSQLLLGILNDILDFSKLEAERLTIVIEAFNLDELIHNLDSLFYARAQEKSLAFQLEVTDDVPRYLLGDSLRLQQILVNLISNSIKFTEQGVIHLLISVVEQPTDERVTLRFALADSGIGISEEQQQHLFQAFTQADGSISRRFGGTGLGLVISRKLAQMMGCDIVCHSILGEGSQFCFDMPFALAKQDTETLNKKTNRQVITTNQLRDAAKGLVNTSVLLVEDNPLNQQVASELLRAAGLKVVTANDGQQALELVSHQDFDVVLMDIQMPVLDGLQATRQLRNQTRFADLPIIAMSAGVTLDEQAKCESAGMTDFIAKPIDPLLMIEKLAKALRVRKTSASADLKAADLASVPCGQNPFNLAGFDDDRLQLLENLLGGRNRVMQSLRQFGDDYQAIEQDITHYFDQNQLQIACEKLHGLKGAASNLGASRLAEVAEVLEKALQQGESGHSELRQFCVTWQAIARTLDRLQGDSPVIQSDNTVSLHDRLAPLRSLIAEDKLVPAELLNNLHSGLSKQQAETVKRLCKAIAGYDYPKALLILKELQ